MCASVAADRGFTWSDEETSLLLQLWGNNDAQSELTGNKRNFVVYEKISETMKKSGFIRTASQCREKIKRMKREYTLTKQQNEKSNGTKKNMRFFEQFENILIEKQNRALKSTAFKACQTNNDVELDNEVTETVKKRSAGVNEHKLRTIAPKPERRMKHEKPKTETSSNPWTPDVVLVEENTKSTSLFENQLGPSTSFTNGIVPLSRKRKLVSQISHFKSMTDSVASRFLRYHADSDAKILKKFEELEDERNTMDERIQKMWMEFEEKRLADNRKHELNIITTFQDIINQATLNKASK